MAELLMERAEMKRLLTMSKKNPVHCAMAMGEDSKTALLLFDKIKSAKALERDVLKADPAARNPRFGEAEVDPDIDPKLVRFRLNRPAPGLARRLAKTLKGTGYPKVEIVVDDETVESAGEEEEEGEEAPGGAAQGGAAPVGEKVGEKVEAGPAQAGGADAEKAAALKTLLMRMLQQVQTLAPEVRTPLVGLANVANQALRGGDLVGAARALAQMKAGMAQGGGAQGGGAQGGMAQGGGTQAEGGQAQKADEAGSGAAEEAPAGQGAPVLSPVKIGKASLLWRGMWAKADKDMAALKAAVLDAVYEDEEIEPEEYSEIEAKLNEVMAVMGRLNLSLADEIDDLRNVEAAEAAQPLAVLGTRLAEYEGFLSSDPVVEMLADNSFHPVSLKADMLKAVQAIRMATTG